MEQDAPAAREAGDVGQVFDVVMKSCPRLIEDRVIAVESPFVTVRVFAPEVWPTAVVPHDKFVGEKAIPPEVPPLGALAVAVK
jgi:hypothetical protein